MGALHSCCVRDDDKLIVMFRRDKGEAMRTLGRGIAELCFAPVLGFVSLPMLFLLHSLALTLLMGIASLVCLAAGVVHIVGGVSGLREASRELAEIEASHKLPEARLIER